MVFSYLLEEIEKGTGKFDVNRQFIINNATDEDIEVTWSLKQPEEKGAGTYKIRAGESGGPYPHFLAYHIVRALVSREMQKKGETRLFASAVHRRKYEEKYLQEVTPKQEAQIDEKESALAERIRREVLASLKKADAPKRGRPKKSNDEPEGEFVGANR